MANDNAVSNGNLADQADEMQSFADTRAPLKRGLTILAVSFGGFLLWATFAPLDEGVPTPGLALKLVDMPQPLLEELAAYYTELVPMFCKMPMVKQLNHIPSQQVSIIQVLGLSMLICTTLAVLNIVRSLIPKPCQLLLY